MEVTWTIRHRRPLEEGEDPFATGTLDESHMLWGYEEGTVKIDVELIE